MDASDRIISRFRQHLWIQLSLRYAVICAASWLWGWGIVVLIGRVAVGMQRQSLAWGAVGLGAAILTAVIFARRKLPGADAVRAMIDRVSLAGGLVMAKQETAIGEWETRTPALATMRARWRGGRAWGILAAAGVFVAIGFALPQRYVSIAQAHPLDVSNQSGQIADQIKTLEDQKIIDRKKADELHRKLEQIKTDATAENPVKTWEALDHLESMLKQTSDRAAEKALAQTQKMAQAQALSQAMAADQKATDPLMDESLSAAAMSHLSDLLKQLKQENQQFKEALTKEGLDPQSLSPAASEKQMRQVFFDKKLDAATREKIQAAMEKLGISPKHAAGVDQQTLDEIRKSLADSKLTPQEREALKQKLEQFELDRSQIQPLSKEQLDALRDALHEMGLKDDQFALMPQDAADQLTSEQLKQLKQMMKQAQAGKQFRQVYLREGLDATTVLKAHLALAKVQMQMHQDGLLERAGTEVMFKLATSTLDKADAAAKSGDKTQPLFAPGDLDTAVGLLNQTAPDTASRMQQLGKVDESTLDAVKKSLGDHMPTAAEVGDALQKIDPAKLNDAIAKASTAAATASGNTLHIGSWDHHIGLVDVWSIKALWRLLADDYLPDADMDRLEANLAPHELDSSLLPILNDDALSQINTAFKNIGLTEDDFALLPPPQKLTPEQLKQLASAGSAAGSAKLSLRARMAKLAHAKLIDAKTLEQMAKAGELDSKGLAEFLAENAGGMSMSSMMQSFGGGLPGQGAPTRGRGDAAMTWRDPASEKGTKFKQMALPNTSLEAMKRSKVIGVSLGSPELSKDKAATSSAALANTQAGGGSASRQVILPKHRAAVEQYFKRE